MNVRDFAEMVRIYTAKMRSEPVVGANLERGYAAADLLDAAADLLDDQKRIADARDLELHRRERACDEMVATLLDEEAERATRRSGCPHSTPHESASMVKAAKRSTSR